MRKGCIALRSYYNKGKQIQPNLSHEDVRSLLETGLGGPWGRDECRVGLRKGYYIRYGSFRVGI